MALVSALATHRWARLQDLELLARVPAEELLKRAAALPAVREAAVLRTCHRVELYLASARPAEARAQAAAMLAELLPPGKPERLVRWREGPDAAHHLLRVAAGLESMVVGEPQVLGQVKAAHELATAQGTAGRELTALFHKAIAAGKRVRTETSLARGAVSVGSAALQLAKRDLGSLEGKRVVLVGTGEMASLVARALRGKGCEVTIASRRAERAGVLAEKVQGKVARYEDLPALAGSADLLVYATSAPRALLDKAKLQAWLGGAPRKLLVLDIANPRNVAPDVARLRGVRVLNLDSLRALRARNLAGRRREAAKAEAIVAGELAALQGKLAEGLAEDVLREVYATMRGVRDAEVAKAVQRMNGAGEREREVVEDLANSIVNKLLAGPTMALKGMARGDDQEALRVAAKLFGVRHVPLDKAPQAPAE